MKYGIFVLLFGFAAVDSGHAAEFLSEGSQVFSRNEELQNFLTHPDKGDKYMAEARECEILGELESIEKDQGFRCSLKVTSVSSWGGEMQSIMAKEGLVRIETFQFSRWKKEGESRVLLKIKEHKLVFVKSSEVSLSVIKSLEERDIFLFEGERKLLGMDSIVFDAPSVVMERSMAGGQNILYVPSNVVSKSEAILASVKAVQIIDAELLKFGPK